MERLASWERRKKGNKVLEQLGEKKKGNEVFVGIIKREEKGKRSVGTVSSSHTPL